MDNHFQYLIVLLACLLVTVPLEFVYGFRVWRNPVRLLKATVPGLVVFWIWDSIAIQRGYWTFSYKFTTGWHLPGNLPLEEALFFLIVPVAAISGFEAVKASLKRA